MNIYWVRWIATLSLHSRYMGSGAAFITAETSLAAEIAAMNMLNLQERIEASDYYSVTATYVGTTAL